MQDGNAIEVKDLTKKFKVYYDKGTNLKEKLLFRNRNRYEERNVLNGISFSIKKGETVAFVGHNGCGKSTTLKLLSKIIYPSSGSIEMKGRVSSLIELGAGFHPDMSGRENIFTNAAIFGLTKKEIKARLDRIIEFSELGEYIDNPVRTYSSGMYMRLAFSVAINVDADILLVDEILAVGDAAYQAKCFRKMKEIKASGTTIVIVSHQIEQIEQICDRSIWIHDGKIKDIGAPRVIDAKYMQFMSDLSSQKSARANIDYKLSRADKDNRWGNGEVTMTHIQALDSQGVEKYLFNSREPIRFRLNYKTAKSISDAVIGIDIYREDQTQIYGTNTLVDSIPHSTLDGEGYVDIVLDCLPVTAGNYTVGFSFHKPDGFAYDYIKKALTLTINSKIGELGYISVKHDWDIN